MPRKRRKANKPHAGEVWENQFASVDLGYDLVMFMQSPHDEDLLITLDLSTGTIIGGFNKQFEIVEGWVRIA